jgi:ADP-ribosylglycohydrolase
MALCLANSLLARHDFIPYDQLVRYKWWSQFGYMSSTGLCFDIGAATSQSIHEFERRQKVFAEKHGIPFPLMDKLSDPELLGEFDAYCSEEGVAGNGALMRLAPVPLFFYRNKYAAVEFSGRSGEITHGDKKAYDACRFYGALIVAALRGWDKKQILAKNFYAERRHWFGEEPLHEDIKLIAEGSYKKKGGYEGGIRGKGYIVNALEAALWAFWSHDGDDSFEKGALAAVNLGDDTDTTAAIYGQLAGAYYGYKKLPKHWLEHVYAHKFMKTLSKWIAYEGEQWENKRQDSFTSS